MSPWTTTPRQPIRHRRDLRRYRSEHLVEFRARDWLVRDSDEDSPTYGQYPIRSGQGITWSRAATNDVTDSNGDTITVPSNIPAIQITSGVAGWLLEGDDEAYLPIGWGFRQFSFLATNVQQGSMASAGDGFLYFGAAAESGLRIWLESTGSFYSLRMHNGSSEVGSTMAAAPSSGQTTRFRGVIAGAGSSWTCRLHQIIAAGSEVSATASSSLDMSAGWPANARVYFGSLGGQNEAACELQKVIVNSGPDYGWSGE